MAAEVLIRDGAVVIEGELTVYFAAEVKPQLLAALRSVRDPIVVVDLARVSNLDTAGLQLLLMTRAFVIAEGRTLVIRAPSSTVVEVFGLCGLQKYLRDGAEEAA